VGYEHPFVDGNGRIARAMTLWGLLSQGYPLFEYLPMSRIHRREKTTYERSFLWGVSDGFDSTYFALYALDAIDEGLAALAAGVHPEPPADPGQTPRPARSRPGVTLLPDEIALKSPQATLLPDEIALKAPQATLLPDESTVKHPQATMLEHALAIGASLNERQRALVKRSLREPDEVLTIRAHQHRFGIAYGTARADLQDLFARGLVVRRRVGRSWEYRTVREAVDRLFE
jgi:Fic family protein